MNRIRWFFAAFVLISAMTMAGTASTTAQGATPIAIPTPTTAGCDQIHTYVVERQKIMDELVNGIAAIFPEVATPIVDHGDQLFAAMMAMNAEQTGQLSKLYDDTAGKIEKLEVPAIALFYNDQIVVLYRLSAKTFAEAMTSDLMTAGQKYGEQLGAIAAVVEAYGTAAVGVCAAFADVVTIDKTQIGL